MKTTTNVINQAEPVLHSLAQLLALSAMQWLPIETDDSQANLLYNPALHRLESRPFPVQHQTVRLVLDTLTLSLSFIDEHEQVLAAFLAEGHSPTEASDWWQAQMKAWGSGAIRPVNYHLDQPPVAIDVPYPLPAGLPAWNYWRTEANAALSRLNDWSNQSSEVRVWPHHFDTGVYYPKLDTAGQEHSAIWAGYAIADSLSAFPYFYLSGYIRGQAIDFASMPPLSVGEWHSADGWTGALLPISSIQDVADTDRFFQESYTHLATSIQHLQANKV